MSETKIFDAHSHYMPPAIAERTAFFKAGWSDLDRQLSLMDQEGIEKSFLLYPTSDAHLNMNGWTDVCLSYNTAMAQIQEKHKDRFVAAGILPPEEVAMKNELKHIDGMGLKALSLASSYDGVYLDDEKFFPVYDFAQTRNFPIHVHPQILHPIGEERVKDPLLSPVLEYVFDVTMSIGKMMMSGTFLKYPDVKFIFAHYGGVLPFVKERFDNTYQMLRRRNFVKDLSKMPSEYFKNFYLDISGSKSSASLLCALEIADDEHILFGSDYPANQDMRSSIDLVEKSSFSAQTKESILRGNAEKVFGF